MEGAIETSATSLFDKVVGLSGLAPIIAPHVLRRACGRAGLEPGSMTARDIPRLIEAMEPSLRIYLPEDEVATRLSAMRKLADGAEQRRMG